MTEKYCPLPISLCEFGTDKKSDCENCELNKRYSKRTIDNWESYIVDRKTGKEYGTAINPLLNLLNEQEEILQKKQKHINHLEDKIHRMRKQIKKLENLYHYRTVDVKREYDKKNRELVGKIKELEQTIDTISKDYEDSHGMDIRNAEWFTAW